MKITFTSEAAKARYEEIIREIREQAQEWGVKGSPNYESAKESGLICGQPAYAACEPHHANCGGSWVYVNMFSVVSEAIYQMIFEESVTGFSVEGLSGRWYDEGGRDTIIDGQGQERDLPRGELTSLSGGCEMSEGIFEVFDYEFCV